MSTRYSRREFLQFLDLAGAVSALNACGGPASPTATSTTQAPGHTPEPSTAPVSMQGSAVDVKFLRPLRFQPTHYHITLGPHEPVLRIADGDTVITLWTKSRCIYPAHHCG